jgi:hypothetical protein
MSSEGKTHVVDQNRKPNPLVQRLAILAGTWDMGIFMAAGEPAIPGKSTFTWRPGEYFLEMRSTVAHDAFPKAHMLIGGDDTFGSYTALYFDSRGVARIYQMSLEGDVWKMWRDAPDFPQRFTGSSCRGGAPMAAEMLAMVGVDFVRSVDIT